MGNLAQGTSPSSLEADSSVFFYLGQSFMRLEDAPCAAYFVRNNPDFTIVCGNTKFFELICCTPQELRNKYGNRLAALMDADSLKGLPDLVERQTSGQSGFLYVEQRVHKMDGSDIWLHTSATCIQHENETVFCCFSFDFTAYKECQQRLNSIESIVDFVTQRIKYEMFIYDTYTGSAQVYTSQSLLRELFPSSDIQYPNFTQTILEHGIVAAESTGVFLEMFDGLKNHETRTACEVRLRYSSGEYMWSLLSLEYFTLRGVEGRYAIGILEDITQQKEALMNFLSETQFFQALLSEKDAYAQLDVTENRILRCGGIWDLYNEIIYKITYAELITQFINKVVHPDDRRHYLELMQCDNLISSLENGADKLGCEFRRIVEQNKMVWMSITIHLFRDSTTQHVLGLFYLKNIDAEKKRQLSMLHSASRDRLTNIYSQQMAEASIQAYLQQARADEICVLMLLDVDDFRNINSQYGHQLGDSLLLTLTGILSRAFRKNDIIGRFGGDEFILFIKNVGSMERMQKRLTSLYEMIRHEQDPPFTCSVGVAPVVGHTTYELLCQHAEAALLAAKSAGKDCFVFFDGQHMALPGSIEKTPVDTPSRQLFSSQPAVPGIAAEPFDSLMSEQGDIAYLVDTQTFELLSCNRAFYNRLGLTEEECRGMTCYEAMQKRKTPCPFCSRANWSSDKFYIWRNENKVLEQEFLIKNKLVQWHGQEVLLAIAVDISNNKSIVDSLDNDATESRDILSGIQRMTDAATREEAVINALETIGSFFRANSVQFWRLLGTENAYRCAGEWLSRPGTLEAYDAAAVSTWLRGRKWRSPLLIENPDVMLSHSFEMYQLMKRNRIQNQRWIPLMDGSRELGCIVVQNVTANFRNVSFIESFCGFITGEFRRRELVESILHSTTHDELTDLLNRVSYERCRHEFNSDANSSLGVVSANIDSLKGINTKRGYSVGDDFLKKFAGMLRGSFYDASCFRLSGDEFLVIAPNIDQADLNERVQRLREDITLRGEFNVSIGHSWDNIEKNLSALIESASQVMRIDKKRHYDSTPGREGITRSNMLRDLLISLERREFEVFLQPKVDFINHTLAGAEALIRYRHKDFGILPPSHFIDEMERNDFIRYIDLFVFEEVCRLLERWKDQCRNIPPVSLNFSRLTLLETDLVHSVESIFSQYDVSKDKIEIEVTESVADMGKGVLSQAVGGLYQSGFAISLDDFGTKYTNLSLLSEMEFNMLKLDKSLISSIVQEDRNQIILKNIIEMCNNLKIKVIAEGIETKAQEETLRRLGCHLGQGYLYGKPMEISRFEEQYMTGQLIFAQEDAALED